MNELRNSASPGDCRPLSCSIECSILKIRIVIPTVVGPLPEYEVRISLKEGIVDPEGENTRKALQLLGFKHLKQVSSFRMYFLKVECSGDEAEKEIEEMCRKLLANPAIHNYSYRKVSD
ncbi:MAG: phosphoribosylformylglycinamidine synthase subunit PurS [Thermoplasmata archaeon]|jgi:phosphoribosylformylglycinamidine synthase|nr:phosphoribosylformylglycinamidine synthase subunit PurS [Candidatus Sysuiplasma jiujiangense]MBX8639416.1 phosphoribosylformylglycinamidine synthase subunit PurS [Candidatus Sysuiplasma jiujiangense]MBX8641559.1 phosphoribosylformylglycinamidine synthase subunit PurS [Candidatus Sysuiplasma jiujiangense]